MVTRALCEHQHSTRPGAHMPFQMELMGEMTALLSLIPPSQNWVQVVAHGLDQSQKVTPSSLLLFHQSFAEVHCLWGQQTQPKSSTSCSELPLSLTQGPVRTQNMREYLFQHTLKVCTSPEHVQVSRPQALFTALSTWQHRKSDTVINGLYPLFKD